MNTKHFDVIIILLMFLAFAFQYASFEPELGTITGLALDPNDNSEVRRSASVTSVETDEIFTVTIAVTIDNSIDQHFVYAIEENVPAGWSIIPGSATGSATVTGQVIKWSYIEQDAYGNPVPASSITFTYQVQAPSIVETGVFSGVYTIDGMDQLDDIRGPTDMPMSSSCTPTTEVCDGVDNDCDTLIDEDASGNPLTQSCYSGSGGTEGVGLCHGGTETCTGGSWGACAGEVVPATEVCDGLDNNCDGTDDEGFTNEDCAEKCLNGDGVNGVDYDTARTAYTGAKCCGDHAVEDSPFRDPEDVCSDSQDNDCDGLSDYYDSDCEECQVHADCDNGDWCDGQEQCQAGQCVDGTAPDCNDDISCTDDSCDELTDTCINTPTDANCPAGESCAPAYFPGASGCGLIVGCIGQPDGTLCDDGTHCNGPDECQSGTCVNIGPTETCDDGIACTDDLCNETQQTCDNIPDDAACDNGQWCDGDETCDAVSGCLSGTRNLDDGVTCTEDSCNEITKQIIHVPEDSNCDDSLWCNGAETCDPTLDCQDGTTPNCDDSVTCTDDSCDDNDDQCVNDANDANCAPGENCAPLYFPDSIGCGQILDCAGQPDATPCDDGSYCNGPDECQSGACVNIGPTVACDDSESCTADNCNDTAKACQYIPIDADGDGFDLCTGANNDCDDAAYNVNPNADEMCSNSVDDDCDTLVDGNDPQCFSCTDGQSRYCSKQAGVCSGLEETCTGETWPGCDYNSLNYYESNEYSCDDKDNDCDGQIDEGCSSGGGSGEGSNPPPISCMELWSCTSWSRCNADNMKTRTCSDDNSCGTTVDKPAELESCDYGGACDDGLMNADEEGIDCGGRCPISCQAVSSNTPVLELITSTIEGEIFDTVEFPVTVKNIGGVMAEGIKLSLNKGIQEPFELDSILPGDTVEHIFSITLTDSTDNIQIQALYKGSPLILKNIPVNLLVPSFAIKLWKDTEADKMHPVIIYDNRNNERRRVHVEYSLTKDGESYLLDAYGLTLEEDEVFYRTEAAPLKNLPEGSYELKASLFQSGEKIGDYSDTIIIESNTKHFNVKGLFYIIIIAAIGAFAYIMFLYKPRGE